MWLYITRLNRFINGEFGMNKTLLLAGVACLVSFGASAQEYKPYVGLDYAFSEADYSKDANHIKDDYSSMIINGGYKIGDYMGVEAFYQAAGDRKTHTSIGRIKTGFDAYGVDLYGYMPLDCEGKFDMLASAGLAIYDTEVKGVPVINENKSRVGYRFGLGAQYNITENIAARLMGRYNYIGMSHLDNFQEVTVGARYSF